VKPLTIYNGSPSIKQHFERTLASLPRSFARTGTASRADVTVVAGPEWAAQAMLAVQAGSQGIVVSEPVASSPDAVREIVALVVKGHVIVEFSEPYAGDPTVLATMDRIRDLTAIASAVFISGVQPSAVAHDVTLSALRTLRAMNIRASFSKVEQTGTAVIAVGTTDGGIVEAVVCSGRTRPRLRVQALSEQMDLDIAIHGATCGRPANISLATLGGRIRFSEVFESYERAAWRRVRQALSAGSGSGESAQNFYRDLLATLDVVESRSARE
jgi:hypothetical protein